MKKEMTEQEAFLQLAARVVTETDRRNLEKEKTKIVPVKG